MASTIGENIKKLRCLKNITREQLASALNMSVSNYSKIERSEIDLTVSRLTEIAQILGVDVSQIINFDASQIFNIHHNNHFQGAGTKPKHMNFHADGYKDKYIKILEEEVQSLRLLAKQKDKV